MFGVRQLRQGAFAFPGNTNFAADDQGTLACIIHERLLCLLIVCETMFTIGESLTISHENDRTAGTASSCKSLPRKIFHWNSSRERRLKFIGERTEEDNRGAERTSLSTAKPANVANTATTNVYRGSDKILQLHC